MAQLFPDRFIGLCHNDIGVYLIGNFRFVVFGFKSSRADAGDLHRGLREILPLMPLIYADGLIVSIEEL